MHSNAMCALGVAVLLLAPATALAECDASDPLAADNDCDEDGVTVGDGDCDDDSADISPDLVETCSDGLDNDCNDQVDEGCDEFPADVVLSGGGQCGVGLLSSGVATGLSALVVLARRERRE